MQQGLQVQHMAPGDKQSVQPPVWPQAPETAANGIAFDML